MTRTITIASNAVNAKIIEADNEAKLILTELLSYFVMGYENTFSYKRGTWDGRSTMFDWNTGMFPAGFLGPVNAKLVQAGYEVINKRKPLVAPLGRLPEALGGFRYTDKYDYQWKGVTELEKRGTMIARLATGAGKTFLAALCYVRIGRPTLILTKRNPLMHQFVERLNTFGLDAGMIGDGVDDIKPHLTVGMTQTINKRLEDPSMIEYLKTIEFVIGEEAHEISDASYWNVVKHCTNAQYKLGLTATPFMKEKSESNMKLTAAFGPVGLNVTEQLLIERGVNATPKIKFIHYDRPENCRYTSNYQKAVEFGITKCEGRNQAIVRQALAAKKRKLPVLILIARQEHGKILQELMASSKIKSKFIFGESNADKRKQALQELAEGKIEVLIGSTIVDVGIDVPTIGCLIIASAGKAEVGYRQRIGRGLRSKPFGPNVCLVVDFMDEHNVHLNEHFRERLKIIKGTPGFAENLMDQHTDLPWELFD